MYSNGGIHKKLQDCRQGPDMPTVDGRKSVRENWWLLF